MSVVVLGFFNVVVISGWIGDLCGDGFIVFICVRVLFSSAR